MFKTVDLEILVMKRFDNRVNLIVPNVSWGLGLHEIDVLVLSKDNYATEIEIKISKADLLKDSLKRHQHISSLIKYFYFCVIPELKEVALETIPIRAGLLVPVKTNQGMALQMVKPAIKNAYATKWSNEQRLKLGHLGSMRILGLKEKLVKKGE